MTTLSEQEFRIRSDEALEQARAALIPLADTAGFDLEIQDGVLEILFEEPVKTKFVVSPNTPARQVWVSAMTKGYKLSWTPETGAFSLGGETLPRLLDRLTREFLKQA